MRQQQGMMMMPVPFGPPPMQGPAQPEILDRVPTRVFVAIKFLGDLADYTKKIVAVASSESNTEIESFENKELSKDQLQARAAACDLLQRYFNGSWEPSAWEVPTRAPDSKTGAGQLIRCVRCGQAGSVKNKECDLCEGTGILMAFPADPNGGG